MTEWKQEYIGTPYSDTDEARRKEALEKAKKREEGFRKSESDPDSLKKRVGMDLFKGGN